MASPSTTPLPRTVPRISLSDAAFLEGYADEILASNTEHAIRVTETRGAHPVSMVFVARHHDVVEVLTDEARFSVRHYNPLFQAIAPPGKVLLMRPEGPERAERYAILRAAAAATPWFDPARPELRDLSRQCVDNLIATFSHRRSPDTSPRPQFDIVGEYGYLAPYLIALRVFGLPGPRRWGLIPRLVCWAENFPQGRRFTPETGPYLTQYVWSQIIFAQLFSDFENRNWFLALAARYCTGRLREHIRSRLAYPEPERNDPAGPTLLEALLSPEVRDPFRRVCNDGQYEEHVVSLMFELVGTAQTVPGVAFCGIIDRWAGARQGLREPLETMTPATRDAFVDESLRLATPNRFLLRTAVADTSIAGVPVARGDYVCALTAKAGIDPATIHDPQKVDFGRPPTDYLHFGPVNGPHRCFGWRVASTMLGEMLAGMTRMPDLREAGPMHRFPPPLPARMMVDFDPDRMSAPGVVGPSGGLAGQTAVRG